MKFTKTSGPYRDECSSYDVTEYKATQVGVFIQQVLKERKDEWGYFIIGKDINSPMYEYRYGVLLSRILPQHNNLFILGVSAHGGWTRMDYYIETQ